MNDETRQESSTEEPEETGPLCGERLKAAREEQQIAVLEIAKELHLDEYKVRALEQNEFDTLGAPVFAKGHLKKYSELVGVDERDVLADYHQLTRSAGMPPVVGKPRRKDTELSPGPWIVAVLVLIAMGFAYWWFTTGRSESTSSIVPAETSEVAETTRVEDAETLPAEPPAETAGDSGEAAEVEAPPEPVADADTSVVAVSEPSPAAQPGEVLLSLGFGEDCWTEVTDATGRRLFFEMGRAGTIVDVSGVAPLTVLLGSADAVTLKLDGEDYVIGEAERRGRIARLTLP